MVAYVIAKPWAEKLEGYSKTDMLINQLILEGCLLIKSNTNPRLIADRLSTAPTKLERKWRKTQPKQRRGLWPNLLSSRRHQQPLTRFLSQPKRRVRIINPHPLMSKKRKPARARPSLDGYVLRSGNPARGLFCRSYWLDPSLTHQGLNRFWAPSARLSG